MESSRKLIGDTKKKIRNFQINGKCWIEKWWKLPTDYGEMEKMETRSSGIMEGHRKYELSKKISGTKKKPIGTSIACEQNYFQMDGL